MWKLLIILGITVGASSLLTGSNCNPQKCIPLLPQISVFDPEALIPDGERLKQYCPDLLNYLQCLIEEIELCTSYTLADLASSQNETISKIGHLLQGSSNLFIDLCDESTDIHKAYAENIVCIRKILMQKETEKICLEDGRSLYTTYLATSESRSRSECLMMAFVLACVSGQAQEECGEPARVTILEIVKRAKVLKYQICSAEEIDELQTTFIDFLELESNRRSIFEEAFDLRRRK